MSSTNFRSILIFASCVVGTRNILNGLVFIGRCPIVHYNGKCWCLFSIVAIILFALRQYIVVFFSVPIQSENILTYAYILDTA